VVAKVESIERRYRDTACSRGGNSPDPNAHMTSIGDPRKILVGQLAATPGDGRRVPHSLSGA
jgi:hypothetical protein